MTVPLDRHLIYTSDAIGLLSLQTLRIVEVPHFQEYSQAKQKTVRELARDATTKMYLFISHTPYNTTWIMKRKPTRYLSPTNLPCQHLPGSSQ